MVHDQFGQVHLFWVETEVGTGTARIFYSVFDGQTWALPIDIHKAPQSRPILHMTTTVDSAGQIHLAWTEGETGPVFYMRAPAYDALSVRNWQPAQRLDLSSYLLELVVTDDQALHLVFAKPGGIAGGLYYQKSSDAGSTWSESLRIDPDAPNNLTTNVLQFERGEQGSLHATWTYIDTEIVGAAGTWVRYARSLDGGETWSSPFTIDESDTDPDELRMAFPNMAVSGQMISVVYAGDSQVHREYRFSNDMGETWSTTARIFGELHGQARGDGLAVDAAGNIHFLGNIRWPTGLYHSSFNGSSWAPVSLAYLIRVDSQDEPGDRISAHDVRLSIRAGNQLVAAFADEPAQTNRGLYVMQRTLDGVSAVMPQPLPEITSTPAVTPSPTPQPTPTSPAPMLNERSLPPVPASSNVAKTLVLGLGPLIIVILLLLGVRLVLTRNH